jgi:hypothetical protein
MERQFGNLSPLPRRRRQSRVDILQENSLPVEQPTVRSSPVSGQARTFIAALVAIVAIGAAIYFWRGQRTATEELAAARSPAARAEQNFKAGKDAIDAIVANIGDGGVNFVGPQAQVMAAILARVETTVDGLVKETESDPDVRRRQAAMYVQFSSTYLALGDPKLAVDSARKGIEIFRGLSAAQPNNNDMQSDVGLSLQKLGEALRANGDINGGLAADRESLDVARALAAKDPGNKQFRTDVVLALWRLASVGDDPRARLTEALKILNNLKLAAILTPAQEEWIGMIANELAKL